jgi:hypothetical protein
MTAARDLADRFHERWLQANPFAATMYGIPGYDALLPDNSEEGERAWRAEAEHFLGEAERIQRAETGRGELTPADAVTLDCTAQAAVQEVAAADQASDEYTVTAMQYSGPAMFLAVAARSTAWR